MKKIIIPCILAIVLLTGCVSKSDYDSVVSERDALQLQVDELTEQIEQLSAKTDELQNSGLINVKDYEESMVRKINAELYILQEIVRDFITDPNKRSTTNDALDIIEQVPAIIDSLEKDIDKRSDDEALEWFSSDLTQLNKVYISWYDAYNEILEELYK